MKSCPQCGEREFYHSTPGYPAWCETCGYTEKGKEKENEKAREEAGISKK